MGLIIKLSKLKQINNKIHFTANRRLKKLLDNMMKDLHAIL